MTRNRFQLILRFLHFADNTAALPNDRCQKIVENDTYTFAQQCNPGSILVVDENNMDNKRKKYDFDNPKHLQELIDLIEDGNVSEIDNLEVPGGESSDEEDGILDNCENKSIIRPGVDALTRRDTETLEEGDGSENDNEELGRTYDSDDEYNNIPDEVAGYSGTKKLGNNEILKLPRGSVDEVVNKEKNVVLVKWLDTKTVKLASNYVSAGNLDIVRRWDKKGSCYVNRPEIVKDYNYGISGVDLMDQMINYYRIFIRSRKWTLRVIMHMIDFALTNSWLEYRKDCDKCNTTNKDRMKFLDFRIRVAESLINMGNSVSRKRGRPASSSPKLSISTFKRRGETRPFLEIQTDNFGHIPEFNSKKEATRCKNTDCNGSSHVFCTKCKIHLCLIKARNCFAAFHEQ
ncbi:uncharacterized protein [Diabrotica undecimpunctata]|uniref:uncharacterized protein n=1 Tax=Diabrotica undecimpunctata TaxID=50387 RepID=UPI003B63A24B